VNGLAVFPTIYRRVRAPYLRSERSFVNMRFYAIVEFFSRLENLIGFTAIPK